MMIDEPSVQIVPPSPSPGPDVADGEVFVTAPVPVENDVPVVDGEIPAPDPTAPVVMTPEDVAQFVQGPFTVNADGTIDCRIFHPRYGFIPFTASPNDPDFHGRAIHEILADQLGVA